MNVVEATTDHLIAICPREPVETPSRRYAERLLAHSDAVTVLSPKSEPLAVVGLIERHPHSAYAWAYVDQRTSMSPFYEIHKLIAAWLNATSYERVEASVRCDFPAGQHWLEKLGFVREGFAPKFGHDRSAHYLYARVS